MRDINDGVGAVLLVFFALGLIFIGALGLRLAEADGKPTATCEMGDVLIKHGRDTYTCNAYNQYRMVEVKK